MQYTQFLKQLACPRSHPVKDELNRILSRDEQALVLQFFKSLCHLNSISVFDNSDIVEINGDLKRLRANQGITLSKEKTKLPKTVHVHRDTQGNYSLTIEQSLAL